jgi:hypothetical protein
MFGGFKHRHDLVPDRTRAGWKCTRRKCSYFLTFGEFDKISDNAKTAIPMQRSPVDE